MSEEVARAMAEGALKHSAAQLSVSCTGIAGPSGATPGKPVGLVHLAAARQGQTTLHEECRFGDIGRRAIRMRSVEDGVEATCFKSSEAHKARRPLHEGLRHSARHIAEGDACHRRQQPALKREIDQNMHFRSGCRAAQNASWY